MLAAIALCVATGILIKSGKIRFAWISGLPLLWLIVITNTAAWEKLTSSDIRVGFFSAAQDLSSKLITGSLPPEKAAIAPQLIFNLHLDGYLTLVFVTLLWLIVLDMLRMIRRLLQNKPVLPLSETPHSPSLLVEAWVRD